MELRDYIGLLRKWWWALLLSLFIFSVPVYFYTNAKPASYRASTTVFVNQSAAPGTITYSDALLNQQLVKTYSQMAEQPIVMEGVRERLGLQQSSGELAGMIDVAPIRDTQLFRISATGRSPQMVADLANATAETFIAQQAEFLPGGQQSGLRVAQPALVPADPVGPMPLRNAILAAILGLLVVAGVVALLEYLDDTVKSPDDMEEAAALATLGAVARQRDQAGRKAQLLSSVASRSPNSEAYRLVRTNLDFASVDRPVRSLLVTSASPGEGKSTIAANLAAVQAHVNRRVILVDADLRRPSIHRIFGLSNQSGLSNMLLSESPQLDDYLQRTGIDGLYVIPSGPLPPNPAELLSSARLKTLISRLESAADLVIIDSPPGLAVSDPMIIASRVDGTLVVVDSTRTRAGSLRQVTEALSKSNTRLLGGILNKISRRSGTYYYYYYSGSYYGDGKGATDSTARQPRSARLNPIARITKMF